MKLYSLQTNYFVAASKCPVKSQYQMNFCFVKKNVELHDFASLFTFFPMKYSSKTVQEFRCHLIIQHKADVGGIRKANGFGYCYIFNPYFFRYFKIQ